MITATDTRVIRRDNKVLEKDLNARRIACMNEQQTHIRLGDWREAGGEVVLVGHARDLHGTVCTCCPRKPTAA